MPLDRFSLEQRLFIYDNFVKTNDVKKVRKQFKKRYPGVDPPHKGSVHNLVKKFRKTGTIYDTDDTKTSKKTDVTQKKKGGGTAKRKESTEKTTSDSQETAISNTSKRRVTRLQKRKRTDSSEVQEIVRDDQEPVFETVKVEMDQEDDDYIPEVTLRPVKAEPLPETEQHEISHQPDKPVPVKVEPNSEETEMDKVADTEVNGTSVKVEPNSDDDSVDESYFSEEMQLLKSNVKTEMEAVDEI